MSTLNEPSPRLVQVLALKGVQPAPKRCVDHHGLLQVLNDIIEIEDPGGFFRGSHRMLLVLWCRANGCMGDNPGLRSVETNAVTRI